MAACGLIRMRAGATSDARAVVAGWWAHGSVGVGRAPSNARPIPDAVVAADVAPFPFLPQSAAPPSLPPSSRESAALFLAEKEFTGCRRP